MNTYQLNLLNSFGYICEWVGIALVILLPLRNLVRNGELKRAVCRMWIYYFCWSVVLSFVLPVTASFIFHDKRAYECFPEMTGIVPVALLGWLPSLTLGGAVWLLRKFFKRRHSE